MKIEQVPAISTPIFEDIRTGGTFMSPVYDDTSTVYMRLDENEIFLSSNEYDEGVAVDLETGQVLEFRWTAAVIPIACTLKGTSPNTEKKK